MAQYNSRSIAGMSVAQQKILCAWAYLGKHYHTQLQIEKLLSWIVSDMKQYKDITNELQTKAWLVEDVAYLDGCPILLVNPIRLSEILDFLLTLHQEWKSVIESLVPHSSSFRNFENLLMAFFDADIIDSCSILPRFCQLLVEKQEVAHEMLSLFRYYSHGEFAPVDGGNTAYTFILYGLRYQHLGDYKKATAMWSQALALNGNKWFRNPLTLYFLMASYAKEGECGVKSLQSFLQDKHKHPLEAVPAIILTEYYASKSQHPSSWRLSEYLHHSN